MPAGPLRSRFTFQRQNVGAGDGMGNMLSTFADIANAIAIAAELKPLRYGETVIAEGIQGRRLYVVRLRYASAIAGLLVADRMIDARDGTAYNIKSPPVDPDGRRKWLEIQVETGGANG
jgi:head-tail adaptor